MKSLSLILLCLLYATSSNAAETLAKASSWKWTVTVEAEGEPANSGCLLDLIGTSRANSKQISLKYQWPDCSLLGPVSVAISGQPGQDDATVVLESIRGGDGDHTGPLIEVFSLDVRGFKRLALEELYDASLVRQQQQLVAIVGNLRVSFCSQCPPPLSADAEQDRDFYVPIRMNLKHGRVDSSTTLSVAEADNILARFLSKKAAVLASEEFGSETSELVRQAEAKIRLLLNR